jgi:hypothetical protein
MNLPVRSASSQRLQHSRHLRTRLILVLSLALGCVNAAAQKDAGGIAGVVRDPSDAVSQARK